MNTYEPTHAYLMLLPLRFLYFLVVTVVVVVYAVTAVVKDDA